MDTPLQISTDGKNLIISPIGDGKRKIKLLRKYLPRVEGILRDKDRLDLFHEFEFISTDGNSK